mmetsp:Transcript_2408/g.6016  ORF Transcript_2408/g.6016 Transcript_2408/m.6016 type:complete len:217 (-) Transcript_2408:2071-2721(-)
MGFEALLGYECCQHADDPRLALTCSNPCQYGAWRRQAFGSFAHLACEHQQGNHLSVVRQHRHIVLFLHALCCASSNIHNYVPILGSERTFVVLAAIRSTQCLFHLLSDIELRQVGNVCLCINEGLGVEALCFIQQAFHAFICFKHICILASELLVSQGHVLLLDESKKEQHRLQRVEQRHPATRWGLHEGHHNTTERHLHRVVPHRVASFSQPPCA